MASTTFGNNMLQQIRDRERYTYDDGVNAHEVARRIQAETLKASLMQEQVAKQAASGRTVYRFHITPADNGGFIVEVNGQALIAKDEKDLAKLVITQMVAQRVSS